MRILQINCVFRKGSTGKIVSDLQEYYQKVGVDSWVVYGRGEKICAPNVYKVASEYGSKFRNFLSRYNGNLYGMGKSGLQKTIRLIERISPDVVHLQCMNGYFINLYGLLQYLKKRNIATLLTLHAEFMYTGNCGYAFECEEWKTGCVNCPDVQKAITSKNNKATRKNWQKMKEAFAGFENLCVAGVSDWVSDRAKCSPILKDKKIVTVLNGLNDTVFFYREVALLPQIEAARRNQKKIVLFVTPHFEGENKGGKWVLELAKQMKDEPVQFIVIGRTEQTYHYDNIDFVGVVDNPVELARWYSQADISLLVSKRETFSMICAESLSCGTPIVGFKAGAPELIALKDYSQFVPYGNLNMLIDAIRAWLEKEFDKQEISKKARQVYSKKTMAENYLKEYENLLGQRSSDGKN